MNRVMIFESFTFLTAKGIKKSGINIKENYFRSTDRIDSTSEKVQNSFQLHKCNLIHKNCDIAGYDTSESLSSRFMKTGSAVSSSELSLIK